MSSSAIATYGCSTRRYAAVLHSPICQGVSAVAALPLSLILQPRLPLSISHFPVCLSVCPGAV